MDVFLVPVGPDRDELYCEVEDAPIEHGMGETPHGGLFSRGMQYFRQVLAAAEQERRAREAGTPPLFEESWMRRLRARAMRWVAEVIAEQRLLWHLRRQVEATLIHPDDLGESAAMAIVRRDFRRDEKKHRFWFIIDTIGLVVSAVLAPIPGPNLIAYYFAFRMVGHFLSMRGARQGLSGIRWRLVASPWLTQLRRAATLDPASRTRCVLDVAAQLHLNHLASFYKRTAA
jgi:hypothetical protein